MLQFFFNSANTYYTIFSHNVVSSNGNSLKGLFKTRFNLVPDNSIDWSSKKCSLLQDSVAISEGSEFWTSSVDPSDTLIDSWSDYTSNTALYEISITSIENQFTQPTDLIERTLDISND